MKEAFLEYAACPACRGPLRLGRGRSDGVAGEIRSGALECGACRVEYPVRNYIPRFVSSDNYASSFGLEWRLHARTQLDSLTGASLTRERFHRTTRWPDCLAGQRVLEAGCGAGRFTEIALQAGCELVSFDLSEAVEACLDNHGLVRSWHLFQGDLHSLPLKHALFDRAFCLGVLQHCPRPRAAFEALLPVLRPGGALAIDVYEKTTKAYVTPRFWLRFITRRISPALTYRVVRRAVPKLLPARRWLRERVPLLGKYLAAMVPIISYDGVLLLSREQQVEWSILDTFDALSPRHEHRVSEEAVRAWFGRGGLTDTGVERADGLIIGRGTKAAESRRSTPEPVAG